MKLTPKDLLKITTTLLIFILGELSLQYPFMAGFLGGILTVLVTWM